MARAIDRDGKLTMARVTSKDVAREAGVSQTTVSFVLNGRDDQGISAETRRTVLEAIDRMGYIPSSSGRELRLGRSDIVICVLPDLAISDATEHFKVNLSRSLEGAGYACLFYHRFSSGSLSKLWRRIYPAAVVSFGNLAEADAKMLERAGIPLLDRVFTGAVELTNIHQEDAGKVQVEYLVKKGHSRIAFATTADPLEEAFRSPREAGVKRACRAMHLPEPPVIALDGSRESLHAALTDWTSRSEPITAVAAYNDAVAMMVLAGCRSLSIQVPHHLAVIGVDDHPMSAWSEPPLSTIALDLTSAAEELAIQVISVLESNRQDIPMQAIPERQMFEVVERKST